MKRNVVSLAIAERSIEEIAKESIPKISVIGVGGGGSNIVSWMKRGITGVRTYAMNSDAQHLSISKADERGPSRLQYHRRTRMRGLPRAGAEGR